MVDMRSTRSSILGSAVAAVAFGTVYQLGGCALVSDAVQVLSTVNPCGTVLACDPRVYEFVTSGIDGPGVVPDADPFCTYAPFCTEGEDPIFGGLGVP
jgi:hypothetical protein